MEDIPQSVLKRITYLRDSYDAHLDVVRQMIEADNGRMFGVDLVVIAAIYRSLSLIDGFTCMVEKRNVLCAAALVRLQVDSVLRLYACCLVDDPHSLVEPLLEGKPLNKIKSKDGNSLSDKYLRTELSKLYPWVNSVYEQTSGFIHLSKAHMLSPVTHVDSSSRSLRICVGREAREWTEKEMIETVEAFTEATKSVIHLAVSWLETKKRVAAKRRLQDA